MANCKMLMFDLYKQSKEDIENILRQYFNAGYRMKGMTCSDSGINHFLVCWMEQE